MQLNGIEVVVIEADPVGAKLTAAQLRQVGANVAVAFDADQALRVLDSVRPRVVVIDLQLPMINGFVLARHITQLRWADRTPVIGVSTTNGDTLRQALAWGCSAYLQKPIDSDRLVETVVQTLGAVP